MNVSFKSQYEALSVSKSSKGNVNNSTEKKSGNFTQNLLNKGKANLAELKRDDDKRYNTLGALLGISVLVGLGIALINRDKVMDFFNISKRRKAAQYAKATRVTPHGGPEIDWSKGRRAIYESWEEYINGIKQRRSQNHILAKEYKELFAQNADKLDGAEGISRLRPKHRTKNFF